LADKLQAVRGMHDLLPDDSIQWQILEQNITSVLESYCYKEVRTPVLEKTDLFSRAIGESTDIVNKEMYTFPDRNDEWLTLRPEGTAGCVRALLQHGLLYQCPQRIWYQGPMFRHERPQKGRLRQFYQIGAEVFGIESADIDVEIILICSRFWKQLGIKDVTLQLNSLGSYASRQKYREALVDYFSDNKDKLDEDSIKRLAMNPLRILDSKNPDMQSLILAAPSLLDSIDKESEAHFAMLCELLDANNVAYEINPRLVRGLDYYNRTVFEWVTDKLGAQGTICAGGRYDDLVEQIGGKPTPGIGFATGLERILELIRFSEIQLNSKLPQFYQILVGDAAVNAGMKLAEFLRDEIPGIRIQTHCGGGSFKSQFKKADKSLAEYALILGDEEVERNSVNIKPLRRDSEQYEINADELVAEINRLSGAKP